MKFFLYTLFIFFLLSTGLVAQTLSLGLLVKSQESGEGLPQASVLINEKWLTTDETGHARVTLPSAGHYLIHIGYISFHDTSFEADLLADTLLAITLRPRRLTLTEVKVWDQPLNTAEMLMQREVLTSSVTALDVSQQPLIAGEPDILKPLQSTPGVQGGLPGSSDIYIRGSDQYQNGVMLDGFPIYNISHAYGYISAIPPGVSEKLNLHKEAYPIQYGNGAAGYINSNIERASLDKINGEAGFGIGSVYGNISLPIKKNKSGLVAGGRFSTMGLVFRATDLLGAPIADFTPGYNDMIVKYHDRLSQTKHLEILGYFSSDFLRIDNFLAAGKMNVHNGLVGITFRNQPLNKWYNTNKVFISNYRYFQDYTFKSPQNEFNSGDELQYKYHVLNTGWEGLWSKNIFPNLELTLGGETNVNTFLPTDVETTSDINPSGYTTAQEVSLIVNPVLFSSINWELSPVLSLEAGTRLSAFFYNNHKQITALPRINLTYSPTSYIALFTAFDRSSQLFHRYRKANFGSAIDLPVPVSEQLPAQFINQLSAGSVFTLSSFKIQLQLFYKRLRNATERDFYSPSAIYDLNGEFFPPVNPSSGLTTTNGQSYGFETSLNYIWNILKLNLAYTWSKSSRKTPLLNNGRSYPFDLNHEHTLRTDLVVRFNRNSLDKIVEIGSSWSFGSGYRAQFPLMFMNSPNIPRSNSNVAAYVDERNNAKLPAFHHLDINFNFIALKGYGSRTFSISLFNVYFNPLYTAYDYDTQGNLVGTNPFIFVPSISWSYKFK